MSSVFFALQPLMYWFIIFFAGVVTVLLTYLTWGLYDRVRKGEARKEIPEARGYEVPTFRDLVQNPVFPWVVALFTIVILSFFLYYVIIGLYGGAIG